MENYLAGKGLFSSAFKAEVVSQFGWELDEAAAKAGRPPRRNLASARH
jgi:hypothetical protein